MSSDTFRCAVLSVVKHAYVPNGVASHPRFELVVVADDADRPDWVHQRNQLYADQANIPYIRDVERAIREYDVQVAVVSSEAERHCDLAVRAADPQLVTDSGIFRLERLRASDCRNPVASSRGRSTETARKLKKS